MLRLGRKRLRRFLPVGRVELAEIARNARFRLCTPPPTLPRVKFRSRLLTALNLLPSMAMLGVVSSPSSRHSSTKRVHTWRSSGPLSLRKSAIVLWSGMRVPRATEAPDCALPHAQAADSTARGSSSRRCRASTEPRNERRVFQSLPARHHRTRDRRHRVHRRRRRSRERSSPRRSSRRGTPAEASTVPDPLPRQIAS